jgi:hypothetical protein
MDMDNVELRRHLQTIVDENRESRVGNQFSLIAGLSKILPHTIKLEKEAKLDNDENWRYNCYTYAFRLLDSPEFVDITERYPFLLANSSYVLYLIERNLTEIEQNEVRDGDYIIYFLNGVPQHAGKIRNYKVVSKWGTYHLWEHDIWEVPIEYGDKMSFYRQISLEECVSAFKTWVDTRR